MQRKWWGPGIRNLLVIVCALAATVVCLKMADVALAQRERGSRQAPVVTGAPTALPPAGGGVDEKGGAQKQEMTVGYSYKNDVSPPLRKMKQIPIGERMEKEPVEKNKNPKTGILHVNAYDPVVQSNYIASLLEPNAMPSPILNFDGIGFPGVSCNCAPPDTDGEVGLTQYVQMVNEGYQVFNKSTGASVLGPASISSLWTGFGGFCETGGAGDPVVLYDQIANRWVITQFAGTSSLITDECIAVSTSSDATGSYNRYGFHLGSNFFDYPHLAVWPDGYYMSMNIFNAAGTAYLGPQAFVFDRAKMIAGQAATFITPGITGGGTEDGFLPADLDGSQLPPAGAPATFIEVPFTNTYRVFHFHADFATPANSTFTLFSSPASAPFTELCGTTRACVPQLGGTGTNALDGIGDRLMFRLAYRNFGTHEAVVGNWTVSSAGVAGIRWFELRNVTAGPVTVFQESTYQPDTTWRWMGSAAQDVSGNMAIGFSASDATISPQIRYAGRLKTDPVNTLAQGEATMFAGTGSQTGTGNRWGDYSDLTIDPVDDCTFWYTTEYYAAPTASFAWKTRIGNFKFPSCSAGPTGTAHFIVKAAFNNSALAGAAVSVDGNPIGTTDAGGLFDVTLPVGSHTYSVSKTGYTTASGNTSISDSTTTNINVNLASVAVIASGGTPVITAESCTANNAIDPGETVTVSLPLTNTGGIGSNTTALTGTLQATGGVTNPSGPQNYGSIPVGSTVSRSFSFTASAALQCGAPVTMTLALLDGATNYGTVSYALTTGTLGPPATTTVSSGNIAVAINDNATVDIPLPNITDTGNVTDVNVKVRLNHTFDGDVSLSLVAPDNTVVPLATNRGSSGANFGTGANDCSGTGTIFDDSAATAISAGAAPFSGSFRPESPLTAMNGKPVGGIWKLRVNDNAAQDTGTVGCVSLDFQRQSYSCCGAPANVQSGGAPPITFDSGGNGKMDPGELVTVNLTLVNFGGSPTTDATATLQLGGGVTSIVGTNPQHYGVLNGGGPVANAPNASATKPFTFRVNPQLTCGGTVTLTFALADGATSFGTVNYTFPTGVQNNSTTSFTNTAAITIPATGTGATTGSPATPYPSSITVAGLSNPITKVTVSIPSISHTFPSDVDMLLVGPNGEKFVMLSDVIGGTDWVGTSYVLDDDAAALIPNSGTPVSGTFKPTNYTTGDVFPAPAPAAPYSDAATAGAATFASVFGGHAANGTWSLYIVDDAGTDVGSMPNGWGLNITTGNLVCQAPTAAKVNVSGRVLTSDGAGLRNATVTLRDSAGNVRTVTTGAFGYYLLTDVDQGSYVIGVNSRLYRYPSRPLVVNDTLSDVDFWPNQ